MSLSLLVVYLNLIPIAFPAITPKGAPEARPSPSPFSLSGNMKRVTYLPVPAMADGDDALDDDVLYFDEAVQRGKKDVKMWDHWGKWSACSVTCGVGKMVRWRHCVSDGCSPGEKEAQIKTCTLSPCQ